MIRLRRDHAEFGNPCASFITSLSPSKFVAHFSSSKPLFIDLSMHSNCHFNIVMCGSGFVHHVLLFILHAHMKRSYIQKFEFCPLCFIIHNLSTCNAPAHRVGRYNFFTSSIRYDKYRTVFSIPQYLITQIAQAKFYHSLQ